MVMHTQTCSIHTHVQTHTNHTHIYILYKHSLHLYMHTQKYTMKLHIKYKIIYKKYYINPSAFTEGVKSTNSISLVCLDILKDILFHMILNTHIEMLQYQLFIPLSISRLMQETLCGL